MAPKIKDVARAAGVSAATVSKVLSGAAAGYQVRAATAERVRRVAGELGYVPDAAARGLRTRRTGQLGVVLDEVGAAEPGLGVRRGALTLSAPALVRRTFDGAILAGLSEAARREGVRALLVYPQSGGEGPEPFSPEHFLDGRIEGLIVGCDPLRGHRLIHRLDPARLPTLALWTQKAPGGMGWADADHRGGGRLAAEHLLALGHRQLGFYGAGLTGGVEHFRLRHQGFLDALGGAGLHLQSRADLLEAVRAGALTAVFAESDMEAAAVVQGLAAAGLTVPGDLSVVGFDDVYGAEFIGPGLTTVYHPAAEMAAAGVSGLMRLLAGAPVQDCRVLVPTRLVVRGTTAPR